MQRASAVIRTAPCAWASARVPSTSEAPNEIRCSQPRSSGFTARTSGAPAGGASPARGAGSPATGTPVPAAAGPVSGGQQHVVHVRHVAAHDHLGAALAQHAGEGVDPHEGRGVTQVSHVIGGDPARVHAGPADQRQRRPAQRHRARQAGTRQADVTVTGPAHSLLLILTRRLPLTDREVTNVSVDGATDLAQHWIDNTAHVSRVGADVGG